MRTDILERKNDILKWIEEERPKSYICQELNCKQETLNLYLEKMNIEYAGQQSKKGQYKGGYDYKPASYYFDNKQPISSSKLREKLFRDGFKEEKCEICGLSEWQGIKIPLELHHIDLNHYNNNLDNLQILCPNCHAIQPGNSGAAVGTNKKEKKEKAICPQCGKEFAGVGQVCPECYHLNSRVVKRPTREQLKKEVRINSFLRLGEKYGVSDKTICKWCLTYNLPNKRSEIKSYSNEEWELI